MHFSGDGGVLLLRRPLSQIVWGVGRIVELQPCGRVCSPPNLMYPRGLVLPVQERVDTGTVVCPVVVASQGSSLNHSA
jgi:hypothetical protein